MRTPDLITRPFPSAPRRSRPRAMALATAVATALIAVLSIGSALPASAAGEKIVVEGGYGGVTSAPAPVRGYIKGWTSGSSLVVGVAPTSYGGLPAFSACTVTGTSPARFECAPWSGLSAGTYRITLRLLDSNDELVTQTSVLGKLAAVSSIPGRIQGASRYDTAAEIARVWGTMFGESDPAVGRQVVFVATGENYPDALSAAAAAAYMDASLVLVKKNELPTAVKSRLNALRPNQIYVLGSASSISNSVVNALKQVTGSPSVTRIAGSDRYDTMRKILQVAYGVNGNGDAAEKVQLPSLVVATGKNFPDALSAAAAVAKVNGAVVLVDGSSSTIPAATLNLIKDLDPREVVIAGSTSSVAKGIETQLKSVFGSSAVKRYAGVDRYDTSVLITDHYFGSAPAVFFAVGTNFPDALAGATLAGALKSPLLVTKSNCVTVSAKNLVNQQIGASAKRVLLGSSASIASSVSSLKTC